MPDNGLLFFVAAAIVLGFGAWAGWNVAGRRTAKPAILPDRVWLCDACKSFNDPTHATCYRCHRPRPADARYVEPDPEFHVTQQLGRTKGSTNLGASSPWLAGEEPLRDVWLTEQARAAEQAIAASDVAPAFSTEDGGETLAEPATADGSTVDDVDDLPLAATQNLHHRDAEASDPPGDRSRSNG